MNAAHGSHASRGKLVRGVCNKLTNVTANMIIQAQPVMLNPKSFEESNGITKGTNGSAVVSSMAA